MRLPSVYPTRWAGLRKGYEEHAGSAGSAGGPRPLEGLPPRVACRLWQNLVWSERAGIVCEKERQLLRPEGGTTKTFEIDRD